jgi:hypothetical protein
LPCPRVAMKSIFRSPLTSAIRMFIAPGDRWRSDAFEHLWGLALPTRQQSPVPGLAVGPPARARDIRASIAFTSYADVVTKPGASWSAATWRSARTLGQAGTRYHTGLSERASWQGAIGDEVRPAIAIDVTFHQSMDSIRGHRPDDTATGPRAVCGTLSQKIKPGE